MLLVMEGIAVVEVEHIAPSIQHDIKMDVSNFIHILRKISMKIKLQSNLVLARNVSQDGQRLDNIHAINVQHRDLTKRQRSVLQSLLLLNLPIHDTLEGVGDMCQTERDLDTFGTSLNREIIQNSFSHC